MSTQIPILKMSVGAFLARAALILLVVLWTLPTFGLLISSLRDKDQLAISGWWEALSTVESTGQGRTLTADQQVQLDDGDYVISGNIFANEDGIVTGNASVDEFGSRIFLPANEAVVYEDIQAERRGFNDYQPGETINIADDNEDFPVGTSFTLNADGTYEFRAPEEFTFTRGQSVFFVAQFPPTFTLDNYNEVLSGQGIGQAFINTFTVTIPATIIPILIAAFAAYAFSWMEFPGRRIIFAIVVGLLVVPLQMSLIPLLKFYNLIGVAKTYPGIWLAHTGFGLPLAIYLLYNYISGLPREIIESAKIDGASHFMIFIRLVLPLSIPALASFSIFQFLWVWNDLLVALVFLSKDADQIVLTSQIRELLGSRGDNWEILTSAAFVSMAVPLIVFFSLQRFFVRGMLAGSVKGG